MTYSSALPLIWVLPTMLLLAWLTLWATRRRVPLWFFVAGLLLAILCFPAGMLAARAELNGTYCSPDNLCFSINEVRWWWNGIFGVLTTAVLGLATLVVTAVVRVVRARNRPGDHLGG
ncbi:hypothetical protein GCM10023196_068350 [Actinoallomurus vinaceus]|uniref:Integral membrane protein n=1 Tax=Actinoallomurus vinaceus TaxID=1080074 RepID=A0ABP8UIV3_9ACTN